MSNNYNQNQNRYITTRQQDFARYNPRQDARVAPGPPARKFTAMENRGVDRVQEVRTNQTTWQAQGRDYVKTDRHTTTYEVRYK